MSVHIPKIPDGSKTTVKSNNALFKTAYDQPSVELQQIGTLGPGKSFGEIACIRNTPRMARIMCITE